MTVCSSAPLQIGARNFGGYPYALAPLILPDPGARGVGGDMRAVEEQLELLRMEAVAEYDERPDSVERLFWFRWITANQSVSAMWQILDDELGLVLSDELVTAARNAETLLDGYSALLIYAGSPTLEIYRQLIRPAMALQHRSFSGRWARDYIPVMAKLQTLRSKYRGRTCPDFIHSLISASKRNHRVHMAVAAKLVPGENSLLSSNDGRSLGVATEHTARLYDAFYSTSRLLVPRESVVEQIIHRLRAITWDLQSNGLYPDESSSVHERPAEFWCDEFVALEENMVHLLQRTGEAVVSALRASCAISHRE